MFYIVIKYTGMMLAIVFYTIYTNTMYMPYYTNYHLIVSWLYHGCDCTKNVGMRFGNQLI